MRIQRARLFDLAQTKSLEVIVGAGATEVREVTWSALPGLGAGVVSSL